MQIQELTIPLNAFLAVLGFETFTGSKGNLAEVLISEFFCMGVMDMRWSFVGWWLRWEMIPRQELVFQGYICCLFWHLSRHLAY